MRSTTSRSKTWQFRDLLMLACGVLLHAGCKEATQPEPVRAPAAFVVDNPYRGGGAWFKANLHLHSAHSDGALWPSELAQLYGDHGYSAIAITDHNQYGGQDGGRSSLYQIDGELHDWNGDGALHPQHVFGSGVEAYVRDWSRKPPAHWRDQWFRPQNKSLDAVPVVFSGFEASHGYFGAHFGLVGYPPGAIDPPQPGFQWLERARTAGSFAFIAHPGDANGIAAPFASVVPVEEFQGLEIANGVRLTCGGAWDATPLWDAFLTDGYVLWGLANDDAHTRPGADEKYPFVAFNVILSPAPTAEALLAALHRGAFYASLGLQFRELRLEGTTLRARVPGAHCIRFIGSNGALLHEQTGDAGTYTIQGHEGYVRVEAIGELMGSGANSWGDRVWSQPFRITTVKSAPIQRND